MRTVTPSIQISIDDDDDTSSAGSPEVDLPKTPNSLGNGSRPNTGVLVTRATPITPTAGRNTPAGRRTPEEKVNKLIDVIDGVATLNEYQEYVKQGELDAGEEGQGRKLSQIPEEMGEGELKKSTKSINDSDVFSDDLGESRLGQTMIDNVDVPMSSGTVFIPYPKVRRRKSSVKKRQETPAGETVEEEEDDEEEEYEMDDDLEDDEEDELKKSILRPTPEPDAASQMTTDNPNQDP